MSRELERFPDPPIVIGGCGRSGTSLLLSILSAHPHIAGIPEETYAFCPDVWTPGAEGPGDLDMEVIGRHLAHLDPPASTTRWCEKTPKNVQVFGALLAHFGERVRLVHIVRDGRDVLTSRHPSSTGKARWLSKDAKQKVKSLIASVRRRLPVREAVARVPYGADAYQRLRRGVKRRIGNIETTEYWVSAERWIEDVSAGRAFEGHPQVHTVRYEDLVQDFEPTVTRLCAFLDEEPVPDLLHWQRNTRVRTHGAWDGEVKPLFSSSVGRWQTMPDQPDIARLRRDPRAIELLRHYGYQDDLPGPTG